MSIQPWSQLFFACPGLPLAAKGKKTDEGLQVAAAMGIKAMELEFVYSIYLREAAAAQVREIAETLGMALSIHGPYTLNLNGAKEELRSSTVERVIKCAHVASICGASFVTFHPAYYLKQEPQEVYARVREGLEEIVATVQECYPEVTISPETTGKPSQFGSLDELVSLAAEIPGLGICIDFAHLHARSNGKYNTRDEFRAVFDLVGDKLGAERLAALHMHYSGLDYGEKGEKKHLPFADSDANFRDLLETLHEYNVRGILVVESPLVEEDVLFLQREYDRIDGHREGEFLL